MHRLAGDASPQGCVDCGNRAGIDPAFGIGDGLCAGGTGKMLDDQPGIQRRIGDCGQGKACPRRFQQRP